MPTRNGRPLKQNKKIAKSSQQSGGFRSVLSRDKKGSAANKAYKKHIEEFGQAGVSSQYSRYNQNYSSKAQKGMSVGKKIGIGVLCSFVIALIGVGTAFALYISGVSASLNKGDKSEEELQNIEDVLAAAQQKNFDEPFYVLLIGSDKREDDEDMGARSDTNIVVRVDPERNQLTMVSIPRDTMIEIDGYGTNKFNAAYSFGGAAGTIKEANELLGIKISHYAEVDFETLVDLVDACGGVDVEVEERIDDPKAGDVVIEEGQQHLDGEAALTFARTRQYVDGDFTRTSHQRQLVMALIQQVIDLPASKLPRVIQKGAECATTDLSLEDILGLALQFKNTGEITIYSAMLPSTTGEVDGVSYVFNDPELTAKMMEMVENGEDPSKLDTTGASAPANVGPNVPGNQGTTATDQYTYYDNSYTDTYQYGTDTYLYEDQSTYVDPNQGTVTDPNQGAVADPNQGIYGDGSGGAYVDPGTGY